MEMPLEVASGGWGRPERAFTAMAGILAQGIEPAGEPPAPAADRIETDLASTAVNPQFSGRLEVFGFADLLQWMELNRRSGRIVVTRGRDRRTLDWREGQIVYVSGSLPRHRLGVHLLRSGALPAATLYELLAKNFTTQENLSRLILEGGHDSLDGLSLRVEELARRLLFELFEWEKAHFEYDPGYHVQPILRIGLSLRGQALAFQGAKKLDDSHRWKQRKEKPEEADEELPFDPAMAAVRCWEVFERVGTPVDPEEGRRLHEVFLEFTHGVRRRAHAPLAMHPVYEDTSELLLELLRKTPFDPSGVISVAALDPYLTLDLLVLANALSVDRENAVGTVPHALERLGGKAVCVLIDRLSAPDFPRVDETEAAARVLRRASVAAAVAAGRFAERFGIGRERGHTLGLLHALIYTDLFEVLRGMEFPAGAFRAQAIEAYRQPLAESRAEAWGLPLDFEAVLGDDGEDTSGAAALVRAARAALPACAIGSVQPEAFDPLWDPDITREVATLFDFLQLGSVVAETPAPRKK
jgi:hypothetical protein